MKRLQKSSSHVVLGPSEGYGTALKVRRVLFACLTGLLCVLLFEGRSSRAQSNVQISTAIKPGYHFIILIDASNDMKDYHRDEIVKSLPSQLFGGVVAQEAKDKTAQALPAFQPDRDQVSVLFFTIHGNKEAATADPDQMFLLKYSDTLKSPSDFSARLREWFSQPGSSGGNYSPIATSQLLALHYLQENQPQSGLYSRTFFIIATNGRYNTKSPGHELVFLQGEHVRDIEKASSEAYKASTLFYFKIPPNWIIPHSSVYYIISELKPQPLPESALQYQSETSLNPQAISNEKLRIGLKNRQLSDLQIITEQQNPDYKFEPLKLRARFLGPEGKPWNIGRNRLPTDPPPLDLDICKEPQCIRDEKILGVSLFDMAVEGLSFAPSDDEPGPGTIRFQVGFQYKTEIYSRLYVETQEADIKVGPAQLSKIPGFLCFPDTIISNSKLASQWVQDEDGKTTQEEAKDRILATRNQLWLTALFLFGALVSAIIFYLYHTRYHCSFQPKLEWQPVSDVVIDFNRPVSSRLLVGTLEVINDGEVPWFGKALKNKEQPTRKASYSLSYNFFASHGLQLTGKNPIGFISRSKAASSVEGLDDAMEEMVSHGKQVYIFCAADTIQDYISPSASATTQGADFSVPIHIAMAWQSSATSDREMSAIEQMLSWLRADKNGEMAKRIESNFTIKPEEQRKPQLIFKPSDETRLCFDKGREIRIGTFQFISKAEHAFAQPFKWGDYTVKTYKDNLPLSGEPIKLETTWVEVAPFDVVEVPVYIVCDGERVTNPDPISDQYTFKLIGDFDAESDPGPHSVTLYRDPARAEIELSITYPEPGREIYWMKDRSINQRLLSAGNARRISGDSQTILLDEQIIYFDPTSAPLDLIGFKVGNSAKAGRGHVTVDISASLVTGEDSDPGIHMLEGRPLDHLVEVYNEEEPDPKAHIIVEEGGDPEERIVRFEPGLISQIEGARTVAGECKVEVKLDILVQDDQRHEDHRTLTIIIPLVLEKLPGLNWLCIDYGTSAIAAALGTGREGGIMPIPLQEIPVADGLGLAQYDDENSEAGSRYLLPSWVICDADLRKDSTVECNPGFSGFNKTSLSLTPGNPDFLGLPALFRHFKEDDTRDRIIYSLKSWLGKSSRNIRLQTKIRYRENGDVISRETVPLEETVESGLAALAEAYLLTTPDYKADQIILSHPNTFTQHHRELLRDIAYRAFGRRFGIPLQDRIQLISESDAVAYYYCSRQMQEHPRSGTERILIYDFGAGTVDLSLIKVEWKKDPVCYPIGWQVEARTGVPVAGHYIDEMLARLIDKLLRDPAIRGSSGIEYTFKLVEKAFLKGKESDHRRAIINLWGWIREAKHQWDGASPMKIRIGKSTSATGIVRKIDGNALETAPPIGEVGVYGEGENLYISIPAHEIRSYPRMAEFMEFMAETVIDELLNAADVLPNQIDTMLVSGRGALWPGLRDKVWGRFPNASTPDLLDDGAMKNAVVRGAIARQEILLDFDANSLEAKWQPKFAVLINHDQDIIHEDDWSKPIDLTRSPTFRIVQLNLKNPEPKKDMKTLRRHFYIDIADQVFRREGMWARNSELYIRKEERNGKLTFYLQDKRGQRISITGHKKTGEAATSPPWPVGSILLNPEE